MLKSTPMTSKNRSRSSIKVKVIQLRSRSSIFELNQDTPEIHPWYKFGANVTNICRVIMFTNTNSKFSCWNRHPWPRKIGQGHPSSNLTKTLLRYIHGISLEPMWLIFVELSCLQIQIANFHVEIDTHDIHGISLDPMRLIFASYRVYKRKLLISCLIWPHDLKNRSRSSIFELNQDTPEIHPWYQFGHNATNIC